ncbi:RNA polymerase sigma factor [Chitinophaga sp. LS1]|uniref:RNA polymerase sigma factor n=1 Tax=Chitinophaga sp. LS1 TaxID=3051176 RepID=UPI002AAB0254|nr:sigma-70 family RNA polymerase sigma factor [Chitinophaga sp. LS1]WPV66685.1 sigma-70 family RNA polymerase sigma factor [Chitinophaga sp. LS1]
MSYSAEHNFTDQFLVEQVLKGDQQAFTRIIRQTEKLVAQIVFKMIPSPADRKDIVQDVYLKVYSNLPGFRLNAKLSTWIGQITYNTCLHYIEKKKLVYLPSYFEEDDAEDHHDRISYKQGNIAQNEVEKELQAKDLTAILSSAIKILQPPIYQTLIILYHQEEMSYGEIAEITSLPEGTVKNYLFRARKSLKQQLLTAYKKEEI